MCTGIPEKRLTVCTNREYRVHMKQEAPSEAKGIRLPTEMWRNLDADASALGMSRSELVRRRLVPFYGADSRKTGESVQKTDTDMWGA